MTLTLERKALARKATEVDDLVELINKYNVFGIASLYKVRSRQLQELSKKFRPDVCMKVSKSGLIKRALKKSDRSKIDALLNYLTGSSILIFTNLNPFKLTLLFDQSKIRMTAKAGDIAPDDILISAGNTGMPPGPAISELHEAGLRTRIDSGSVWVLQDTIVAKKGEAISAKVASVLSKLGVKPLEVGLRMLAAYDNELILTSDQLVLDLDGTRTQIDEAFWTAMNLAVNIMYPTTETIRIILQSAQYRAKNVAIMANYATPEVIGELIAKASTNMRSLATTIAKINKDALPPEFS
ncbi:MAG: large subunit ribosomal protein [Thermoproteota archaeon]|nr:large subunit ribosomal protein [Thermoproteota archaeon]